MAESKAITSYLELTSIDDSDMLVALDAGSALKLVSMKTLNTGLHNSIYQEKNITTMFDDGTFTTNIADGSFKDIYPGNYIQKTVTIDETSYTVKAIIVDLDHFYGGYSSYAVVNTHHVACLVTGLPSASMNATNTTEGGYAGSVMHTETLPKYLEALQSAFDSSHFMSHQKCLTSAVGTTLYNRFGNASGAASTATWYTDQYICLPSEVQIYGSIVYSSSCYDTREACKQFAAMRLMRYNKVLGSRTIWLRDVANSSLFCNANDNGIANSNSASNSISVVPLILLK